MSPIGWRVLAAAVALVPAAALAADPPGAVTWVKGDEGPLGLTIVEGVWAQRIITVRNTETKDRQVRVACLENMGERGDQVFSRICTLPAGTERRVEIAVRPGLSKAYNRPTGGAAPSPKAPKQVQERYAIWDARGGEKLHGDFAPAELVSSQTLNLGIIPGDIYRNEWYLYLRDMPAGPLGDVHMLASAEYRYATRWYGYSMASVLILIDPVPSRMRPSQVMAVLDWVRRGGVLVLAGAHRLAEALDGELGEAAGVGAVSVHYVSKMAVSGLRPGTTGLTEVGFSIPLPMVELVPAGAEVIHECNGMPLLTRHGLGEGAVFTLAMPVASLLDKELQEVWGSVRRQFLHRPPVRSDDFLKSDEVRGQVGAFSQAIREDPNFDRATPADRQQIVAALEDLKFYVEPGLAALNSLAGRKAPPRWVPVAILAAMAAAVAVGGGLLRRRRRGELLWLVLAPVSLVLAGALYFVGQGLSNPAESLRFVGMVSSLGDGRTRVQEAYSYYSGHQTRKLTFSAGCDNGVLLDAGDVLGSISLSETRTDRQMLLPDQTIQPGSDKKLFVDGVVPGLKFQPEVSFDSEGLAGTIQNDLGFDLSGAVIYVNDRTYRVGTSGSVPQGRSAVHVAPGARLGLVETINLRQALSPLTSGWSGRAAPGPGPAATGGRATPGPARGATPAAPAPSGRWTAYATRGSFTASLSYNLEDVLRNRLLGCLVTARAPMTTVEESPLLIGYGDRNILDPLKGRPVEGGRQGWNVVVWPLRIHAPAPGTAVQVPSGFARVQYAGLAANMYDSVVTSKDVRAGTAITVRAQLPAGMPPLKDAKARLALRVSAKSFRMTVLGRIDATKKEQRVAAVDRPSGIVRVEAPSADAFVAPDGAYYFVLRFAEMGQERDEIASVGNTFDGAEVDLEGIAR